MTITCHQCDADEQPGSGLCFECVKRLRRALVNAARLAAQVEVDLVRLSQQGDPYREGGRSSETLLVFDDQASEAAWILNSTVTAWANELTRIGIPFFQTETTVTLALWLSKYVIELSKLPNAKDCVGELDSAMAEVSRVVDRGPARIYLTDCPSCQTSIHGTADDVEAQCKSCGSTIDVAQARETNRATGRGLLVTASEAHRWLGEVYGKQVTARRIRVWAHRGKLTKYGDRYRVGDILELLLH